MFSVMSFATFLIALLSPTFSSLSQNTIYLLPFPVRLLSLYHPPRNALPISFPLPFRSQQSDSLTLHILLLHIHAMNQPRRDDRCQQKHPAGPPRRVANDPVKRKVIT